jgi:PAS domain S-box-containing protein
MRIHPSTDGTVVYVLDVTGRERTVPNLQATAERLRRIIDTAPVYISYVDPHYRFQNVSQHYVDIFKRPRKDIIGSHLRDVLGDDVWPMIEPHYRAAFRGEVVSFEIEAPFKGVGTRYMHVTYTPDTGANGEVRGIMTVVRDITESKNAERLLKESDSRKDEFLATLAHELRNPLAPLSNALQILRRVEGEPSRVPMLREIMERQVDQLRRLIDDLLDISRISRGKIDLRKRATDIATIMRDAIESVQPAIDAHRHQLTVDMAVDIQGLDGDHGRLIQVFGNLIHNAVKYTPAGGRIHIEVRCEGVGALARITDTGIGIPSAMLHRIFEPFTQVDQSLDRAQGGLGIGLTLVKTIVEMHGGRVGARSEGSGKGSELTVWLPFGEVLRPAPPQIPSCSADLSRGFARHRFLVVDDIKESGDTLAMLLEHLGQEVRSVHDGFAALEAVRDFSPHVVISDIAMPGMDGYALAQRIRQECCNSPVLIALTGYGQKHDRERALEAGFHLHLVKPVASASVIEVLNLMERSDAQAASHEDRLALSETAVVE